MPRPRARPDLPPHPKNLHLRPKFESKLTICRGDGGVWGERGLPRGRLGLSGAGCGLSADTWFRDKAARSARRRSPPLSGSRPLKPNRWTFTPRGSPWTPTVNGPPWATKAPRRSASAPDEGEYVARTRTSGSSMSGISTVKCTRPTPRQPQGGTTCSRDRCAARRGPVLPARSRRDPVATAWNASRSSPSSRSPVTAMELETR